MSRRPAMPPGRDDGEVPGSRVSDGLVDRMAERRRARRRLRLRAVAITTVVALVLAGVGYVLLASPVLALRLDDVTVTGTNEIATTEDVLEVVAPHQDQPLLRLDAPALREELGRLTGVLDVSVQRAFPNGLLITVVPRQPVATVKDGDEYVLLDSEGVELARTAEPDESVPLVRVPVGTDEVAGALTAVLEVVAAMPPELAEQVRRASASTAYEVSLRLDSGARVVWGSAEDSELKAQVLLTLLAVPAEVYDVSAPLNPITR